MTGEEMQTTSIAREFSAKETGLFNQIALFSVMGLAMSMVLVANGLRVNPWF
ncbi:MAG TPA: hypothetical protein VKT76_12215 [Bradyrhizobium sp.]|nr:hypothetical protein [Bradyrhizobium sp.]